MTYHPDVSAATIETVDSEIRDRYAGTQHVDEIAIAAAEWFSAAGVDLNAVELHKYAETVRDDRPFEIKLQ